MEAAAPLATIGPRSKPGWEETTEAINEVETWKRRFGATRALMTSWNYSSQMGERRRTTLLSRHKAERKSYINKIPAPLEVGTALHSYLYTLQDSLLLYPYELLKRLYRVLITNIEWKIWLPILVCVIHRERLKREQQFGH